MSSKRIQFALEVQTIGLLSGWHTVAYMSGTLQGREDLERMIERIPNEVRDQFRISKVTEVREVVSGE